MNEQTNIDTDLRLQNDAELLAKLVGKTVVHLSSEWCAERGTFRKFYSIRRISSVELELEPHKAIVMRFCDKSKPIMFLNLDQFDSGKFQQEKKAPVIPVNNAQSSFFQRHTVYSHNKNYFIIVEIGDDMATISKETGVSLKKIYQYNDLPRDYAPTQGDLIYLKKKQKCASKQFKKNPIHIVEHNQSLFDISQLYGIRLKSLYKLARNLCSHSSLLAYGHPTPYHTLHIGAQAK